MIVFQSNIIVSERKLPTAAYARPIFATREIAIIVINIPQ